MGLPFKDSAKYTCQTNTWVTTDTKSKLQALKQMGINVGELQRQAIKNAVEKALKELDKNAS